jgi:heparan-alpha-glucosaminide N-acetyltransferase
MVTHIRSAGESSRVLSVDIFRGLTMMVMVFVNDLSGVKGLPWWNYHMPPGADGMTYVDMVFPEFLFIVGMAIPLAIQHRLDKGDSTLKLWVHVVFRSLALIILGIFLANHGKVDPALTGIGESAWALLGLIGAILFWNIYPRSDMRQGLYRILKYAGLLMLAVALAILRRRTPDGQVAWLDFGYWEILGLIGQSYLAACILYIPFRKIHWAPVFWLTVLTALNVFTRLQGVRGHDLPLRLWPFGNGELASIIMAGVVASMIFLDKSFAKTFKEKAIWGLSYASVLFLAGYGLRPLGLSKNEGTPTWCLYCASAGVLIVLVLYWIADVKHQTRWAGFVKPAGSNTLLTYLLPYIFYSAFGGFLYYWVNRFGMDEGFPGLGKSLLFTGIILVWSGAMTKLKFRLQL